MSFLAACGSQALAAAIAMEGIACQWRLMQSLAPRRSAPPGNPESRAQRPTTTAETPFARATSWLLAFVIANTLNGYPLAGVLAALLGVESTIVTYPYRAISVAFALLPTALVLARGRFTLDPLMTFFLLAYAIRLYYDYNYSSLPDTGQAVALFFATVIVPFFAISICRFYYVNKRTLLALLIISAPSILLIITLQSAASAIWIQGSRFGFDALNPISVGVTGVYSLVAIYFLWLPARPLIRFLILAPLALASLYIVVLSGSRGPMVGLLLCIAAISVRSGARLVIVGSAIVAMAFAFGDRFSQLNIVQRFEGTAGDMSTMGRVDRIISSVNLTIENPLFGFGYIENKYYSYPHNLLIESGLALGLGGFAVMLFLQIRYGLLILAGLRGNAQFVAMLGIIGISSAWLSSTLWGSISFWTPMALLVALAAQQRQNRRRSFLRSGARN